ncbi:MAG: hypothetical protein AB1589_28505 [Cyanobacteriota bacterium]
MNRTLSERSPIPSAIAQANDSTYLECDRIQLHCVPLGSRSSQPSLSNILYSTKNQ